MHERETTVAHKVLRQLQIERLQYPDNPLGTHIVHEDLLVRGEGVSAREELLEELERPVERSARVLHERLEAGQREVEELRELTLSEIKDHSRIISAEIRGFTVEK